MHGRRAGAGRERRAQRADVSRYGCRQRHLVGERPPQRSARRLVDGASYTVTADVSDKAGNPATQATHGLSVDESAPTIAIDAISGDDVINAAESHAALTITGTSTGAEQGQ